MQSGALFESGNAFEDLIPAGDPLAGNSFADLVPAKPAAGTMDIGNHPIAKQIGLTDLNRDGKVDVRDFAEHAKKWQGVPYKWGGTTSKGFDCSGLTQCFFKEEFGVSLPRTAREQARAKNTVPVDLKGLQPGDLVFWTGTQKNLKPDEASHVAVYMGDGMILDAGSKGSKVRPIGSLGKPPAFARRVDQTKVAKPAKASETNFMDVYGKARVDAGLPTTGRLTPDAPVSVPTPRSPAVAPRPEAGRLTPDLPKRVGESFLDPHLKNPDAGNQVLYDFEKDMAGWNKWRDDFGRTIAAFIKKTPSAGDLPGIGPLVKPVEDGLTDLIGAFASGIVTLPADLAVEVRGLLTPGRSGDEYAKGAFNVMGVTLGGGFANMLGKSGGAAGRALAAALDPIGEGLLPLAKAIGPRMAKALQARFPGQGLIDGGEAAARRLAASETGTPFRTEQAPGRLPISPAVQEGPGIANAQRRAAQEAPVEAPVRPVETTQAVDDVKAKEPWEMTREEFRDVTRQSVEGTERYNYSYWYWPDERLERGAKVPWHDFEEVDLETGDVPKTEAVVRKTYAKGSEEAEVYQAYVPMHAVPSAKYEGELDLEEYLHKGNSPYPAVVLQSDAAGNLSILDGNHRIAAWEEAGYDYIPAWIVDVDGHRTRVVKALKEGKPVPAEVLADYPDLAAKYGKPDVAPVTEPPVKPPTPAKTPATPEPVPVQPAAAKTGPEPAPKPSEPPPKTPDPKKAPATPAPKKSTAAKNAVSQAQREEFGLSDLPEATRVEAEEMIRGANEAYSGQEAARVIAKVQAGEAVNSTEQGVLVLHREALKKRLGEASGEARESLLREFDAATLALKDGGSETARTLAFRRFENEMDMDALALRSKYVEALGRPLTKGEAAEADGLAARYAALTKQIDELTQRAQKAELERDTAQAFGELKAKAAKELEERMAQSEADIARRAELRAKLPPDQVEAERRILNLDSKDERLDPFDDDNPFKAEVRKLLGVADPDEDLGPLIERRQAEILQDQDARAVQLDEYEDLRAMASGRSFAPATSDDQFVRLVYVKPSGNRPGYWQVDNRSGAVQMVDLSVLPDWVRRMFLEWASGIDDEYRYIRLRDYRPYAKASKSLKEDFGGSFRTGRENPFGKDSYTAGELATREAQASYGGGTGTMFGEAEYGAAKGEVPVFLVKQFLEEKGIETKIKRTSSKRDVIRKTRAEALESIKAKWAARADNPDGPVQVASGFTSEDLKRALMLDIAPDVLKLVKSFVDEGILSTSEVVKRTVDTLKKQGLPVDDDDVKAVIAGEYRQKRESAKQAVSDWRKVQSEVREEFAARRAEIRQREAKARQEAREAAAEQRASKRAEEKREAAKARDEARERIAKAKREHDEAVKAEREWMQDVARQERDWRAGKRAEERAERKDYQEWWKRSVGGQKAKLLNDIDRLQTKLADLEAGKLPEAKVREDVPSAVEDLWFKREALRVEARKRTESLKQKARADARSAPERVSDALWEVASIPRSALSTGDISAPFNQGAFAMFSNPRQWASAWTPTLQVIRKEGFEKFVGQMRGHKMYDRARVAGLEMSALDLRPGEDMFVSELVKRIPGYGEVVKFSEREYAAFLTKLRMEMFEEMVASAEKIGAALTPDQLKETARFVNTVTGRGQGAVAKMAGNAKLANVFFAPSYWASLWETAALVPLRKSVANAARTGDWRVAKQIGRRYAQAYATVLGAMGAASIGLGAAGFTVHTDWRDKDFGRATRKRGRETQAFDLMPPQMRQFYSVMGRLIGGTLDEKGKAKTGFYDRGGVWGSLIEGKAAPSIKTGLAIKDGKAFGKSYDVRTPEGAGNVAKGSLLPISVQQVEEVWNSKKLTPAEKAFFIAILGPLGRAPNIREKN